MVRSAAIIVLAWALILGAFFVLPIGRQSGLREIIRIGADIALIGALVAWQIRRISVAELPELRAAEALGIVVAIFLVAFSAIYLSMSHHGTSNFTSAPRPNQGALLHHHRLLDRRIRRHHPQDGPGPPHRGRADAP